MLSIIGQLGAFDFAQSGDGPFEGLSMSEFVSANRFFKTICYKL